jgi:hypothetical protein
MSCHKQEGPAAACALVEKFANERISGDQWHELKKMAEEEGYDVGRSKASPEATRAAMEKLLENATDAEKMSYLSDEQRAELSDFAATKIDAAVGAAPTLNNTAVMQMMADKDLSEVLAEADKRAKAARAAKDGREVPKDTGKDGEAPPPLSAMVRIGRSEQRFYCLDPQTKAQLEMGFLSIDDALNSGKAFPSITNCLQQVGNKAALIQNASNQAALYGEERLREIAEMSPEDREAALDDLLTARPGDRQGRSNFMLEAADAANQQRDKAAARGTEVHAIAEAMSRGENPEVPEELQGYVDAAKKFREEYPDMKFIYTEATVYNPDARTMGTTDAIVELDGKRYVLDYKTNKNANVRDSVGMQLAAAANAESIVHADGSREPMPKIDGGIGVGFGPDGEVKVFKFETDPDGLNHQGFKAARAAWDWSFATPSQPRPVTREAFAS